MSILRSLRWVWVFGAVAACGWVSAAQDAEVRLPSAAAGGGTLGLYLQWPDTPAQDRFVDGAPVMVFMHGGSSPGSLRDASPFADGSGFVVVQFVYPGGSDQGIASDGFYDNRGPLCIQAARDIWLFALGLTTDELGRSIDQVVGREVRSDLMGVGATSNGTTITPVILGRYPEDFAGKVRWVSLWENIGNDQVRTGEIGRDISDCMQAVDGDGNGLPDDEGKNPLYDPVTDYAYPEVGLDYSTLAWDPTAVRTITDPSGQFPSVTIQGLLYFDGSGNGALDHQPLLRFCTDVDNSGVIEADEDWYIGSAIREFRSDGTLKLHYSRAATRYLDANPGILGPGGWPSFLATLTEAEAFHADRTPSDYYGQLAAYARSMRTLSTFDQVPHFYVTEDFLEVRIEQDGLKQSGVWRRLNPDASYYAASNGSLPPGYPDSPANLDVPIGDLGLYAAPTGQELVDIMAPAIEELVDRTYYGGWSNQLSGVLTTPGVPGTELENLVFDTRDTVSWDAAPNNLYYDLFRGSLDGLSDTGDRVDLGATVCIEEDSADLQATDSGTPPAGQGWFYLARPNGIGGSLGIGSSGLARDPQDQGCAH